MFNLIISIFLVKLKFRERFKFLVHNTNNNNNNIIKNWSKRKGWKCNARDKKKNRWRRVLGMQENQRLVKCNDEGLCCGEEKDTTKM
jgi:hypothetical protein